MKTNKYAVTRKEEDGYRVYLEVNYQSFCLSYTYRCKKDADWMRKQLTSALNIMIIDAKGEGDGGERTQSAFR